MFKYQYKLMLLIVIIVIAYFGFLQRADRSADMSIEKLLEISGIKQQVAQLPVLIKGSVAQSAENGMAASPAEYAAISNSVDASVLPSSIIAQISAELKTSITKQEALALVTWYQSALGKKIALAEEQAQTDQAYDDMIKQRKVLMKNTERMAFAHRLDALIGATKMTTHIQNSMQIAVNSAISLAIQPEKILDSDAIMARIQASSSQINAAVEQMVAFSFVYSYQALSNEELIQYEAFLNQAGSKKFNKIVMSEMQDGLAKAILTWLDAAAISLQSLPQEEV